MIVTAGPGTALIYTVSVTGAGQIHWNVVRAVAVGTTVLVVSTVGWYVDVMYSVEVTTVVGYMTDNQVEK